MRLGRFDPNNIRVSDDRSSGGSSGGGFPGGGGGKIGCGTLVVVLIGTLVFGIDPGQMLGLLEGGGQQTTDTRQVGQQAPGALTDTTQICEVNTYATEACNALDSLNRTWQPIFEKANIRFDQPTLHFYRQAVRSGCGVAQSSAGPFYCPADQGIYIDTSFYDELAKQLGAKGDFARYYVIAHEYGHHVQKLTGVDAQVRREQENKPQQANALQVRMELQADCYAGVWAAKNKDKIEPGDMEEGLTAASAIGDDTLMKNAGQQVNPDNFTHGSSADRVRWLRRGLDSGNEDACDTFGSAQ